MKHSAALITLISSFILYSSHAAELLPVSGRWITASGNLEIAIAPCDSPAQTSYCGKVVRVMANNAMASMPAAQSSAGIGLLILSELIPNAQGEMLGRIYNRADGKSYHSLLRLQSPDQLKLSIYADNPAQAQVQIWQRATAEQAQ
jgi:uncharacterized protein (DUF2147 family)